MAVALKERTVTEYQMTWDNEDLATPMLIDPLLDDMFKLDEEGKTADKKEALQATRERAKEILTWGEITMGDLNNALNFFYEGYDTCLKRR